MNPPNNRSTRMAISCPVTRRSLIFSCLRFLLSGARMIISMTRAAKKIAVKMSMMFPHMLLRYVSSGTADISEKCLTLGFFNDNRSLCDKRSDRPNRGKLRSQQYAHDPECHRDFHNGLAFLIFDDHPTDVSLMEQFLDLGNKFFTFHAEFFRFEFLFCHRFLQL